MPPPIRWHSRASRWPSWRLPKSQQPQKAAAGMTRTPVTEPLAISLKFRPLRLLLCASVYVDHADGPVACCRPCRKARPSLARKLFATACLLLAGESRDHFDSIFASLEMFLAQN